MLHKNILFSMIIIVTIFMLASCSSQNKIQRTEPEKPFDLSGRWNDVDSRLVAEEMVKDVTQRPWLVEFAQKSGRKPVVIVGTIRNLSTEHIETGIFQSDIERELINGGNVKFVASKLERNEVRDEREDQQINASDETAKKMAMELGADFMMQGSIKTIIDAIEGKKVIFYQVDMQLINLQSNEKVWVGTKEIKKLKSKPSTKW